MSSLALNLTRAVGISWRRFKVGGGDNTLMAGKTCESNVLVDVLSILTSSKEMGTNYKLSSSRVWGRAGSGMPQ